MVPPDRRFTRSLLWVEVDKLMAAEQIRPHNQSLDVHMTGQELTRFIDLIREECGITLGVEKQYLLVARLGRRIRSFDYTSYQQYYDYLRTKQGRAQEMEHFIDIITTNTTGFFRENKHFEYIEKHVLPMFSSGGQAPRRGRLACWSAGCSTGQEAYSLAMVMAEYFADKDRYSILATDVSTRVLEIAKRAIFPADEVEQHVPLPYRERYMMQGTGPQTGKYRVVSDLRNRVSFQYASLATPRRDATTSVDIILCRNVLIYFDQETRVHVVRHFYDSLSPDGFLFIGHAETLTGMGVPFKSVAPTIYRKAT
jgi:chemotaxis protein methyltransferase CheR